MRPASLLLLLCIRLSEPYDQELVNNVADFVMDNLKKYYPHSFPIPYRVYNYAFDIAQLEVTGGLISNFSTINRVGDIKLSIHQGSVLVNFQVQFDDLRVKFDEYKISMFGSIASSGSLDGLVVDNLIGIEALMGKQSRCFLTINKINVIQLDSVDLYLYKTQHVGYKVWKSWISSMVSHMFTRDIKSKIQEKIRQKLPRVVKEDSKYICKGEELY